MILMKTIFFCFIIFLLLIRNGYPQDSVDTFETWNERINNEWTSFSKNLDSTWYSMENIREDQWKKHIDDIKSKWNKYDESLHTTWVIYTENNLAKSTIDFKDGLVKIEELVPEEIVGKKEIVAKKISRTAKNIISIQNSSFKEPLLSNQLPVKLIEETDETKEIVKVFDPKEIETYINNNVVNNIKLTDKAVVSTEGKKYFKAEVDFYLNEDHLSIRAQKYKNLVAKYCKINNIEPALVMAIIEHESAFNPYVSSSRNGIRIATGLMQLVPWSGGKDAYNALGYIGQPTREYLLDPENNIMLGTKYLEILSDTFKEIEDPDKVRTIVISAYNTGPNNVIKTFSGEQDLKKAVTKINSLSLSSLHTHLNKYLLHEETKKYLAKVYNSYNFYKN